MNESRHNQYIKTKSVKVPSDLKLNRHYLVLFFKYFLETSCDDSSALTDFYSLMKNKSVKFPFVAKNSKHLVEQVATIRQRYLNLPPCEKQECQITPRN